MNPPRLAVLMACLIIAVAGCGLRSASGPAGSEPQVNDNLPPEGARTPTTGLQGALAVGVPCGLAMPYKEVRKLFQQANPGVKFEEHVADIGPLVRQIKDGQAQWDVLINFGEVEIEPLQAAGKLRGEPTPFLRRDMDLCVQKGNPLEIKRLEDLAKPQVRQVAICNAGLTLGRASEQALKTAGVWEKLKTGGKIARFDQPLKAKQAVIQRQADAALIYAAGKLCSVEHPERCLGDKADVVMTVPEQGHGGMVALAVVLGTARNPELAERFISFMRTPQAQEAIAEMGYGKATSAR